MSHFGTEKAPLRFACEKAPLYSACDNQTLCFLKFGEMLEIIKYTYHMYYMWYANQDDHQTPGLAVLR